MCNFNQDECGSLNKSTNSLIFFHQKVESNILSLVYGMTLIICLNEENVEEVRLCDVQS